MRGRRGILQAEWIFSFTFAASIAALELLMPPHAMIFCWLLQAEAERLSRADKELEGATFQPAITKKAWELKMRESSVPDSDAADKWNRMHARGMTKVRGGRRRRGGRGTCASCVACCVACWHVGHA